MNEIDDQHLMRSQMPWEPRNMDNEQLRVLDAMGMYRCHVCVFNTENNGCMQDKEYAEFLIKHGYVNETDKEYVRGYNCSQYPDRKHTPYVGTHWIMKEESKNG